MDDWQLLQDYHVRNSESAFRTLVHRHVNLVYSVALRQVGHAQLAEEIVQSVFMLLARKAAGFERSVILSGWLFRTTRFVGIRALRKEQRRQRREQEAFAMQQLNAADDSWQRISPLLDEALERLRDSDRNAVILRFFNDKNNRETAAMLGISEEAAKKRVARAIDKMRRYFTRRGIALSGATLASMVAANSVTAAPASFSNGVAAKVLASTSLASGILPQLVTESLNAWRWARLRLLVTSGVTAAAVVIALITLAVRKPSVPSAVAENPPPLVETQSAELAPPEHQTGQAAASNQQVLHFKLLARDTGEPIANARLIINYVANHEWKQRSDVLTDETGAADIRYPVNCTRLDVGALSWGWAARFATWKTANEPRMPSDYVLQMDRVTNAMSGWLQDEQGQPVANAEVEMQFGHSDMAQSEPPRERLGLLRPEVVARSDKNGWWTCAVIAPYDNYLPTVVAHHPEFAPAYIFARTGANNEITSLATKALWSGTAVTTMIRGVNLKGRIVDEAGHPVAHAQVAHNPASMSIGSLRVETESAADGSFVFRGLATGDFDFIVTAPGFAQQYQKVIVTNGITPFDIRLKAGGLLRLRVVDDADDPMPDAWVALTGAAGTYAPEHYWSGVSGPDGRIEWDSAPPERDLNICASKEGWLMTRGIMVKADGQVHEIKLRRAVLVTGHVVDSETGQPVLGVKSLPGYGLDYYCWYRGDTWYSTNDVFQVRFTEEESPWRVRVEADGYEPFVSDFLPRDFNGTLDVALIRADSAKAVRGQVLLPDGQPAIGVEVTLLTRGHGAYLGRARFAYREATDKLITDTDGEGRFRFEYDPEVDTAHTAIAVSESGFARVPLRQLAEPLSLRLEPWGRVEGMVDSSARKRPVDSLYMQVQGSPGSPGTLQLGSEFRLRSLEGRDFAFDFVPAGDFYVALSAGAGVVYPEHHRTWLTVRAGETTRILVTDRGHILKGRLVATDGEGDWVKRSNDEWSEVMPGIRIYSHQYLRSRFAKLVPLARELSPEENASYNPATWETGMIPLQHNYSPGVRMDAVLALATDGSFESLEGVLPGSYSLQVSISGRYFEQQILTVPEGVPSIIDFGSVMVNTNTPVTGRRYRLSNTSQTESR